MMFVALVVLTISAGFWNKSSANRAGDDFLHQTAAHKKISCSSCHKSPTANWSSARGFPDIADYPNHASCVQCHRNEFFRGNHPAICAVCHVNVGPRGDERFDFPQRNRPQEFEIIFPHDVHQDIIAANKSANDVQFANASYRENSDDENKSQFNNCTICHPTSTVLPEYSARQPMKTSSLTEPAAENFSPKAQFFKEMPGGHATCFNCHYQGQKPVRTDCASCHRLTSPFFDSNVVRRISLKFDHSSENHANKDCTSCHIRITQTADLRNLLNADVPLLTCSTGSCHGKELTAEMGKRG